MKKVLIYVVLAIILGGSAVYAQEEGDSASNLPYTFGMTVDYSVPFGPWAYDGFDDFRAIMGQRIGFLIDIGYKPLPFMALGIETGVRVFYFDLKDSYTGEEYGFFLDVPIRAFLRFGKGMFFIQPFGGYYLSFWNKYLQGAEVGVKVSVIGVVLEGSYVFGDLTNNLAAGGWVKKDYWRIAVGYRFALQ